MTAPQPEITLPNGIGPHEGKELDLMLAGTKPVAMFGDSLEVTFDWGEDDWTHHIESGRFIKHTQILTKYNLDIRQVYFGQPDRMGDIEELMHIQANLFANPRWDFDLERRIGKLLGYEDCQIDAFITHIQKQK